MSKKSSEYINDAFSAKNNQLLKRLHQIFTYLTYEFKNEKKNYKNENDNLYIKEIIYALNKNEYLLNKIKDKIEKKLGENINEIVKSIFSKANFEKNDIEFIDIIYKKIYDEIFLLLFKFIFKSEKDHFLSPFLFNYEIIRQEKDNLNYIDKYINNFDFSLVNVVERMNSNKILLILNLFLPLSKKWYDLINIFIENNIKEDYIKNEEILRIANFEKDKYDKHMDNYSKIKSDCINNVKGEILRIDGLNDLVKNQNINYMKMIYVDFMTIYLTKKFKDNIEKGIQFLDILIQLRLNITKDNNYSFIDNNKKKINLQDSFSDIYFYNQNNNNN